MVNKSFNFFHFTFYVILLFSSSFLLAKSNVEINRGFNKEIRFNAFPSLDENLISQSPFIVVSKTESRYVIESNLQSVKLDETYKNALAYYSDFKLPEAERYKEIHKFKFSYVMLLKIPKDNYGLLTIQSALWSKNYVGTIDESILPVSFSSKEGFDQILSVAEAPIRIIGNVLQDDGKYIAVAYNPITYSRKDKFFKFATKVRFRVDLHTLSNTGLHRSECDVFYYQSLDSYLIDNCYFNDIVSAFRRVLL
ncbi:hypothetical protein L4D00_21365 [Photobacterium swingsii]|uniref:hypothetical protein n=1 Tax=Photobacterium swingsii TaxID=680026 RepID=UPI003D0EFA17